MKDYSTGKIYAIRSAQTGDIYIGSTIQPLCVRMAGGASGTLQICFGGKGNKYQVIKYYNSKMHT